MSAFLEGLGKVFGKVADQFQGRIERTKNKIKTLEKERSELLGKPANAKNAGRIVVIDRELIRLRGVLEANAKD